ncbi:unnamed protein product, partial [Meganyctiphanes norvegica]
MGASGRQRSLLAQRVVRVRFISKCERLYASLYRVMGIIVMGEPGVGNLTQVELNTSMRPRKRILDPLEAHEDDINARRVGLFTDWHDTLKGIGVPNKKGYHQVENSGVRQWVENEDIDQGLAADFDDSLSGLGVDISTASYNMSEALMALPNVPLFKQEAPLSPNNSSKQSIGSTTPTTFDDSSQSGDTTDRLFKLLSTETLNSEGPQPSIHQLLQAHLTPSQGGVGVSHHVAASHAGSHGQQNIQSSVQNSCGETSYGQSNIVSHSLSSSFEDNRYQYILGAATSFATKVNEETLSYLNQGQSYEIKVKKLGDLTRCKGKLYHTVIRVCFHERRLQYMEREQLQSWRQMRPGERILEIDIPLSYGVSDVTQDWKCLNNVEFDWDPTKEVGVYIKVNCISTEFTPKKHGGEKGVPFRIQVETYSQTESGLERLHVCACQIKVFKLKGADRKHKQDREKIMKRPPAEQEKYQPSCECTILCELTPETMYIPIPESPSPTNCYPVSQTTTTNSGGGGPVPSTNRGSPQVEHKYSVGNGGSSIKPVENDTPEVLDVNLERSWHGVPLNTGVTAAQTLSWLVANRFAKYSDLFANFTGTDILRLSRSDLIEMCGLADGIRLFNSLHAKKLMCRLSEYVYQQQWGMSYLENFKCI